MGGQVQVGLTEQAYRVRTMAERIALEVRIEAAKKSPDAKTRADAESAARVLMTWEAGLPPAR